MKVINRVFKSELAFSDNDQMFSWENPDDGKLYHFNPDSLKRYWIKHPNSGEPVQWVISEANYKVCKYERGIEQYRLDRLTADVLGPHNPIMIVEWFDENGTEWWIGIDGNHRMVWAYEHDIKIMYGILFKKAVWEKCLMEVRPKYRNKPFPAWSGIT